MHLSESELTASSSVTKTVESGAFIRTTWRKGKNKHQKTIRINKNMEKVVLCHIGDFELYVYPYDYPDKVFMGKFPVSTVISSTNVKEFLGAYNQVKWFLENQAFSKPTKSKGANSRRQSIQRSYNLGLEKKKELKNKRDSP